MKKFLIEIAVLISLLLFALYFLDTGKKSPGAERFIKIAEKLDVINLGNSHGGSCTYATLNLTAGSFNRAGNTLYYDLQNYKYLKRHLSDSAIIILPVSYFSFGLEENRVDRGEVNPFVNVFYEYLPPNFILNYSLKKDLNLKISRIQKRFNALYHSEIKKKPKKKKKRVVPKTSEKITHLINLLPKLPPSIKKYSPYGEPARNVKYLTELIADAQMSGYRPILITTPYYQAYNNNFDKGWLKDNFYRYMDSISSANKIKFLDYSRDSLFS